jgi:hypothetical protein
MITRLQKSPDGKIYPVALAKTILGIDNDKDLSVITLANELKSEYEQLDQKLKEKQERDAILEAGTLTSDGEFWFNEEWAKVFMTKVATARAVGFTYVKWKNAKREVVELPLDKADEYMKEMIATLDKVYLGE